ncbi:hypothetical protein AVEN_52364-1, partial [Araneus ventricosus]
YLSHTPDDTWAGIQDTRKVETPYGTGTAPIEKPKEPGGRKRVHFFESHSVCRRLNVEQTSLIRDCSGSRV